jgi:hypothetical protein
MNRCLDHGRVDPHPTPTADLLLFRDRDDAVEHLPQGVSLEELPETDHRLGVRHIAHADAAEIAIRQAAAHFPFERLVAPVLQVLEHEHAQSDLRWRARSTLPMTLWMALREHLEHTIHQLGVVQSVIDTSKARLQKLTG